MARRRPLFEIALASLAAARGQVVGRNSSSAMRVVNGVLGAEIDEVIRANARRARFRSRGLSLLQLANRRAR